MTACRFDAPSGSTLYIPFCTYDANGASVTMSGFATSDILIYKNGSVTQRSSTAGFVLLDTDGTDFDAITGLQGFSIDLSDNTDAGFYAIGSSYWVVLSTVTVNAQTVTLLAAWFRIVAAENTSGTQVVDVGRINNIAATSVTAINANIGATQPLNFTGTGASALVKGDAVDINGISAASVTTINANIGQTQPLNFTGTGASALVKGDTVDIAGAAVSTASAQIGVNAVQAGGTVWGSGAITAGAIAAGAITNTKFGAGAIDATAIADAAIDRATFAADTGLQTTRSNTAQAGAATTITLDASASATTDFYKGAIIYLTGGTGVGQARLCTAYNGATKVATVTPAWAINPDVTSTFGVVARGGVNLEAIASVAIATGTAQLGVNVVNVNGVSAAAVTTVNANIGSTQPLNFTGTGASALLKGDAVDINGVSTSAVTTINANIGQTQPLNFTGTGASALVKGDAIDINGVSAAAVTTINANIGQTQPLNFTGTAASALVKSDMVDIAGAAVSTASAQIGVNAVNAGGTAWGSGAITAASIATDAITAAKIAADAIGASELAADAVTEIQTGITALTAAGVRSAVGLASANLDTQLASITPLTAAGVRAAVGLASANIDTQISGIPASVWALTVEGANTALQYMRGFASALLGKASGMATTTAVFRDTGDTKPRITATVDTDGNRSSVTLDLT